MSKNNVSGKYLKPFSILIFLFVVWFSVGLNQCSGEGLLRREWTVDGVVRAALVYVPPTAKTNAAPVVFAFHGHGGTMRNAANTFHVETLWPEAIVVYMQGLNTPGRLTDPEGKLPGWQSRSGEQKDRDLKFFDVVLASLEKDYKLDAKRLYAMGHSNGGSFTYLLWEARGEKFAAFAPSSTVAAALVLKMTASNNSTNSPDGKVTLSSIHRPVLHVAGETDPLVKFEWQKTMMTTLREFNKCDEGKPWKGEKYCTIYKSKLGDVVTYVHPGTHKYPDDASKISVKFLKEHTLP